VLEEALLPYVNRSRWSRYLFCCVTVPIIYVLAEPN